MVIRCCLLNGSQFDNLQKVRSNYIVNPLDLWVLAVNLEVLIKAVCAKLSHSSVVDFDMPTINWQKVVDGLFELDLYGIHSSRILTFQVY